MASVINTNLPSLTAQRNLLKSQNDMQTAMQRLSSGLRINSAKDDAAGLAISDRMTAQINGLNQATRNANDAMSIAQVAEGALGEVTNALQRIRVLAVQSANDTNTATDRASLQKEVNQLQQEITRLATQTSFNGKSLLDGSFMDQVFHVGAYADQNIKFSIGSTKASDIGANLAASNAQVGTIPAAASSASVGNGVAAQTLTVDGPTDSAKVTVDANMSAYEIAQRVNQQTATTGVSATARTEAVLSGLTASGTIEFTLAGRPGQDPVTISAKVENQNDLTALAQAINQKTGTTGISAQLSDDLKSITLVSADGYDIKLADFKNTTADATVNTQVTLNNINLTHDATGNADSLTVAGQVSFSAPGAFTVTSNDTANTVVTGTVRSELSAVGSIDVGTQQGANDAIKIVDGALAYVDDLRADLGAIQNRFSSVVSSNSVTSENVAAARSRVLDADFAAETANLSRAQILQQAGTAMLAQANASTQNVLTLLR